MTAVQTRRGFLSGAALAGAAATMPAERGWADEPALETTTVRLGKLPVACDVPIYAVDDLLRAGGFTDVRFVNTTRSARMEALGRGEFDFTTSFAVSQIGALDASIPITILAGLHAGCFELFTRAGIHGITDLKGKLAESPPALLIMMAASVGLDRKDIDWVTDPALRPLDLFADGDIDALLLSRRSPSSCAPAMPVTSSSIRPWTGRGRNIFAACWSATANSSAEIQLPPSARCAPS